MSQLSQEQKRFIIEKASKDFGASHIAYMMQEDRGEPITKKRVETWLNTKEAQEKVQTRKEVREKKAEIDIDELREDLVNMKEELKDRIETLHDQDLDTVSSDQIDNLRSIIRDLSEMVGEIDRSTTNNVIKINELNQSIENNPVQVFKHLPDDTKEEIVREYEKNGLVVKETTEKYENDDDDE